MQISLFRTCALISLTIVISCANRPPAETGEFKPTDLVEVVRMDTTIHLDIRYATNKNFVGRPVYAEARAFLQRPAVTALLKVHQELRGLGYGLVIFDAYRPWSVTKMLWDVTSEENKKFVANPKNGSRHNRGCAVDVTLYEITTGKQVDMPGQFDEMSERSNVSYPGGTIEQRKARDLLRSKMEAHGFKVLDNEWWHFDYKDWRSYRISNIAFTKIR